MVQEDAQDQHRRQVEQAFSDNGDVPDHIRRLYDQPEEEWGVVEWQTVAVYLVDEVKRLNNLLSESNRSHQDTLALAEDSLHVARKHRAFLATLEGLLASRSFAIVARASSKKAGRPTKLNSKLAAAITVLAKRHGPSQAAKLLAGWQLKAEGMTAHGNRVKLASYTKTWENKVAPARRMMAAQIDQDHGPGLQSLALKQEYGLLPRRVTKK